MLKSRMIRNATFMLLVVAVCGTTGLGEETKKRKVAGLLQMLPSDTLFCVRVNNLDGTVESLDAFLSGIAGAEDIQVKEKAIGEFAKMLGEGDPKAVRMKGTFGLFGLNVPSDQPSMNPFGGLFLGVLMPVNNYKNFVARNANVGKADAAGISEVKKGDRVESVVTQVGGYALMTEGPDKDKLAKVKKMMTAKGKKLGRTLNDTDKMLAKQPVWAYANVQEATKLFGPMIFMFLEQMKTGIQQAQSQGAMDKSINPEAIIKFYSAIIETMIKGTGHVSAGVVPSADSVRVTLQATAIEGSLLAELMVSPDQDSDGEMLAYLENGAAFNVFGETGKNSMRTAYMNLLDLLASISPDALGEQDLAKMKAMTNRSIDAMGDSVAVSVKTDGGDAGMFSMKYVIAVSDEAAFAKVIEDEFEMIKSGMFTKIYKGLGIDMGLDVDRGSSEYKGVKIGSATMKFTMGDEDSDQNKAIKMMYGDGLKYCWAILDGKAAYAMGGDSDKDVRSMIDQIKAGGPEELASEIAAAIDVFGEGMDEDANKDYDFGGTVNIVRMMNMVGSMASMSGGPDIKPMKLKSNSNIVFAGRSADGSTTIETVVPKKHVIEIISAGKKLESAMKTPPQSDDDDDEDKDGDEEEDDEDDEGHGEEEDDDK